MSETKPAPEQPAKKVGFLEALRDRKVTPPENPRQALERMAAGASDFGKRLVQGALDMDNAQTVEQQQAAAREASDAQKQKFTKNLEERMAKDAKRIAEGPTPGTFDARDLTKWQQEAIISNLPGRVEHPINDSARAREQRAQQPHKRNR